VGAGMGFSVKIAPGVEDAGIQPWHPYQHWATRRACACRRWPYRLLNRRGRSGSIPLAEHAPDGEFARRSPSIAALQRQVAAAQKAEEAQRLAAIFREILNVHRQDFRPPSGRLRRRRSWQLPPGSIPLNSSAPLTMRQMRASRYQAGPYIHAALCTQAMGVPAPPCRRGCALARGGLIWGSPWSWVSRSAAAALMDASGTSDRTPRTPGQSRHLRSAAPRGGA
jgi:hypothetical protein